MAYSKDPSVYPAEFAGLYTQAMKASFEFECENSSQAVSLRHQLHGYRRAIEAVRGPGWSDLRKITIQLRDKTLIFSNNSALLNSIRATIKQTEPSERDIDAYLEQMEKDDAKT